MSDDSDLLVHAGFSTAKMEAETRKVLMKYEEAGKRSAKKFDDAMAKVSNNEALKATAREVDRLARKFDPVYAASKKYERGVKELNRALDIGSISNKEYEQGLEDLVLGLERGGKSSGKLEKAMYQNSGSARAYRGVLQNVGWQAADFATQVGAGTSAMQAAGQQLPQLLGAFGAFGAGAGAVAAILLPVSAAIYQNLTGAVDLEEQMKALTESTDAYVAAIEAAETPIETLREKYGDLADDIAAVNAQTAIFAGANVEVQTDKTLEALTNAFGGLSRTDLVASDTSRGFWSSLFDNGSVGPTVEILNTLATIQKELGVSEADAKALVLSLEGLANANGADGQIVALERLNAVMLEVAGSGVKALEMFGDLPGQTEALLNSLSKQAGARMTEEERRREQIFNRYTERDRELAKLIEDRGIAEAELHKAQAEGDLKRIELSRQVVAGIDNEIDSLTDAKGRVEDLSAEAEILVRAFEGVVFDPNDANLKSAKDLAAQVMQATLNVDDLNDADLSALEDVLRKLGEKFEDIAASAREAGGAMSVAAQNASAEYGRSRITGENMRRGAVTGGAIETIKRFESFRSKPYWDVNAYRAGFGSDTVTLADGSVRDVTKGMTVSYADANRDLLRRVGEFQDVIIGQIGRDRFNGFNEDQQAMLTSIAYNYGELPDRIVGAVRGGTNQDIATAIARLQSDNGGINRGRRLKEASVFGNTDLVQSEIKAQSERQRELEKEAKERQRLLDIRATYGELMRAQIDDAELENDLIGKTAEEQARMRAEYHLTQEAKRRGIDLNERIAGTEETYGEAIKRTAAAMAEQVAQEERLNEARDRANEKIEFHTQLQTNLKDGLIDAIIEGKNFADVLSNVAKMLAKATLEAALFNTGPFGGGGGSGLLGGLFNGLFAGTGAPSFDGGGFTGHGARSGGIDGRGGFPAILHPNETVIDHTRASAGGAPARVEIMVSPTGEFDSRVRQVSEGVAVQVSGETVARNNRNIGQARRR